MTSVPFLSVENLCVSHGNAELVRSVSFTAQEGRVTGILGESGCGKSLTCMGLLDLLPPGLERRGRVLLRGKPFSGRTSRELLGREISVIMQNPMSCFDSVFTLRSHFNETMRAHNLSCSDELYAHALSEVGLNPDILHSYPFQLSGGMLQRVMIALALIMNSPFLLADEPTTDLDALNQARVLMLLDSLKRERGMGMIIVTHDLGVMARLADDVIVMRAGVIVESGPVSQIFRSPREAYTAELVKAHMQLCGAGEGAEQ
ncbi:MAG: ABC transporter ATP-binding protein [Pyramidobacter sp.]|nr:ABC transporter ATP-binding protein [Pyramidobacter sp.]